MEIIQYAPVIIPTLNRYSHFKRCLESLECCIGADKTDVYVGLDYPPSDSYVDGWKKIESYLSKKEESNGFKKLIVFKRSQNCGISGPMSNSSLLMKEVAKKHSTYIFTEDDNEFSPNFLEFINIGLLKYEGDNRVLAVSGYLFPEIPEINDGPAFLAQFSSAWGTGYWFEKQFEHAKMGDKAFVDGVLYSWKTSWRLYKKRAASLNGFISMHFRNKYYEDVMKSAEMLIYEKYSLFPSSSKVRNWGHDGTGVHCDATDKYIKQKIDGNKEVDDFNNIPVLSISNLVDFPLYKRIAVLLRYIAFRCTGKDILSFYWMSKR